MFSLRSEDPARHRRGPEQLFLSAMPAAASKTAFHSKTVTKSVVNSKLSISHKIEEGFLASWPRSPKSGPKDRRGHFTQNDEMRNGRVGWGTDPCPKGPKT